MSNPYLNLSLEEIENKISESLAELEAAGIDEAAIDKMILAERRKLDPYAPQTRTEFEREWSRKEDMKWYERVGAGLAQTPEMFKYVFGTLGGAMVDQAKFVTDLPRGLKSLAEGGARGTRDLWEMVKGIGGEIGDWGRGREDHINREYQRYLDSLEYQRVRDAGILFDQDEVFEDYTEATSLILDPSNFIPFSAPGKVAAKVARKGVKTTAKAGAKVAGGVRKIGEVVAEKASLPRKKFADFLNDVARMHPTSAEGASVAGTLAAAVSSVPLVSPVGKALLGAEAAGIGAKVGGEMAEGVLNALASDNVAKRFLTRIAESPDVPMTARRLANFARKNGGQWALDKAYNTILASVEIGTINGALQWAATGDPEGFGAGVAQGIAMSPIIGLVMPNNAGLSAQDRVDYATQNFIDTNGAHLEQLDLGFSRSVLEDFAKTPEGRRTLEVLGALDGLAPELNLPKLMHFFDEGTYNQIASNPKTDGEYNPATREIFIKVKKDSANTVAASGLHEVGHYILANILETNPAARDFLINELTKSDQVIAPMQSFNRDGTYLPTRSNDKYSLRELTTEAAEFKKRYEYRVDEKGNIKLDEEGNPIRRGPAIEDLETLVQEMGAETIGELLYGTTPTGLLGLNNHALRGAALSAVSQLLSRLMPWRDTSGTAEPGGFARLDPNFKGLPILRDLFNNYRKVRQTHLDWRTRLEEMDGVIKSKDGKTARELVVNIAPDTQLFDTKDLEAMDGAYGKQLRQAHKAEPPASNEASVGPRVKGDRASGIGEKLSSATKKFFSNILSKGAMDLIEQIEAQVKNRRVIGGWYSKRADKRGNNELTYREMVPYGIGLSIRGNLILYGWNLNKLHDAIILAEEMGLVTGRTLDDGTKLSAADVLRERIKAASDRQARGERIADELVAALFGARYSRDTQIKDTRHIEFARELNRRRAHPSQTLRIDTMQGFRSLDKDGFMFNWVDISNNNRPNRPARASGRAAVGRAVAEALEDTKRPGGLASAERDAEYMQAVNDGDMGKAQELVDQAAKAAGYNVKAYHGTPNGGFVEFNTNRKSIDDDSNTVDPNTFLGAHFAEDREVAQKFAYELYGANKANNPQVYGVWLKLEKPLGGDSKGSVAETKAKVKAGILLLKKTEPLLEELRSIEESISDLDVDVPFSLLENDGITAFLKESERKKANIAPDLFSRRDKLKSEIERITKESGIGEKFKQTSVKLPGGEAFLSGERGLISEDEFGLQKLSKISTGRDPRAEIDPAYDRSQRIKQGKSMRAGLDQYGFDSVVYNNQVEGGVGIIVANPNQIKSADPITRDDRGNIIPLSERFDSKQNDIRYSAERTRSDAKEQGQRKAAIGVAALRKQVLPTLGYAQQKGQEQHFKRFLLENKRIAEALGITVDLDSSVIGGWKEGNDISRENSQRLIITYDKPQDLQTYVALLGSLAPEVQNAVMTFEYTKDGKNREVAIEISPERAEELTSLQHLEKFNLEEGFTYDPQNNEIIFATWDKEGYANVLRFIDDLSQQGAGGSYSINSGRANFPGDGDYRRILRPARLRKHYGTKDWNSLHSFADEARKRLAHKPKQKAQSNFRKQRKGRSQKVVLKDKGRTVAEHEGLLVNPATIYPQGSSVIGDLTKQQSLGWNQFKEANAYADEIQASLPDAGINPQQWGEIMALRTQNKKQRVVARLPETLADWIKDPELFRSWWREHSNKEPLYVQSAIEGLGAVLENHQLARESKIPVEMTAAHMLWAVASIAAGPFAQEAGWISMVNQPRTWELLFDSIDGKYNLKEEQWRQHVDSFSRSGIMAKVQPSGKLTPYPGNSVTSNLNSMHKMLQMWNGRWNQLNDIINNPELTGPQMRDEFFDQGYGGAYLGPKILSFVLATLARDDVIIVDRWQLINLWKKYLDNKVGGDPFRYEKDGTPVDTTNFYDTYVGLLSGTQGLGVFKALESGMDVLIDQNFDFLKEELAPVPPSRFALHWAMWDMIKGEAVGHSSLDATQKFLLENRYPKSRGDRAQFIEEFTNEPKSTTEFQRTEQGPSFRKLEVQPGRLGEIRTVTR